MPARPPTPLERIFGIFALKPMHVAATACTSAGAIFIAAFFARR
jgi:hypothetical protein